MNAPPSKTTFTVHEAKTHLSRLIAAALEGEEVVIARGKTPAVRLVPVEKEALPPRKPGAWKGLVKYTDETFDPWTPDDLGNWFDKPL